MCHNTMYQVYHGFLSPTLFWTIYLGFLSRLTVMLTAWVDQGFLEMGIICLKVLGVALLIKHETEKERTNFLCRPVKYT